MGGRDDELMSWLKFVCGVRVHAIKWIEFVLSALCVLPSTICGHVDQDALRSPSTYAAGIDTIVASSETVPPSPPP